MRSMRRLAKGNNSGLMRNKTVALCSVCAGALIWMIRFIGGIRGRGALLPYKEESLRWLAQAQDEFADADELRVRGRFYLALFHFQQAAEKALKAYLYMTERSKEEIFTTHSLDDLMQKVRAIDRDFRTVKGAKKLDEYAIRTRYPDSLPGRIPSRYFDDPKEAEEAMNVARVVVELAARKIGEIVPRSYDR